jgi:hypothetical protein
MLVLPFIARRPLVLGWKSKPFYLLTAFFLLGLLVTITPWLIHNYLQTGELAFDASFQYATLASQYAYTGNLETSNYDPAGKGLGQILLDFALKDPAFVFGFISNHFPQRRSIVVGSPSSKIQRHLPNINLYWMNWDGMLEWYNILLLFFYLVVIAIGLGSAELAMDWAIAMVFSPAMLSVRPLRSPAGAMTSRGLDRLFLFWHRTAELLLQARSCLAIHPRRAGEGMLVPERGPPYQVAHLPCFLRRCTALDGGEDCLSSLS